MNQENTPKINTPDSTYTKQRLNKWDNEMRFLEPLPGMDKSQVSADLITPSEAVKKVIEKIQITANRDTSEVLSSILEDPSILEVDTQPTKQFNWDLIKQEVDWQVKYHLKGMFKTLPKEARLAYDSKHLRITIPHPTGIEGQMDMVFDLHSQKNSLANGIEIVGWAQNLIGEEVVNNMSLAPEGSSLFYHKSSWLNLLTKNYDYAATLGEDIYLGEIIFTEISPLNSLESVMHESSHIQSARKVGQSTFDLFEKRFRTRLRLFDIASTIGAITISPWLFLPSVIYKLYAYTRARDYSTNLGKDFHNSFIDEMNSYILSRSYLDYLISKGYPLLGKNKKYNIPKVIKSLPKHYAKYYQPKIWELIDDIRKSSDNNRLNPIPIPQSINFN